MRRNGIARATKVDAAALLVASGAPTLYADADRGGSDSPLAGELGLGGGQTVISRIQWLGGSRIRLNDNDNPAPLTLETYFLEPGRRIIVQTLAGGAASFVAADHTSEADAGGGYVNFRNLPADVVAILDGIVAGTRFIFAVGQESPELAGIARAAIRVRGDVGVSVRFGRRGPCRDSDPRRGRRCRALGGRRPGQDSNQRGARLSGAVDGHRPSHDCDPWRPRLLVASGGHHPGCDPCARHPARGAAGRRLLHR